MGVHYVITIVACIGIKCSLASKWTSIASQIDYDNYSQILTIPAPETTFLLVSPDNYIERTEIPDDFSNIDSTLQTFVLTHGWNVTINTSWCFTVPRELQKRGRSNIILVNWNDIADEFYTSAAPKTKIVGAHLAQFLLKMGEVKKMSYAKVHLIGHSLGAHVSGFAGKIIKQFGYLLTRITALDPAYPGFATFGMNNQDYRVSDTDAITVVVLHTDGGKLGIFAPIGTVDFYANCGTAVQPACYVNDSLLNLETSQLFCSHSMAPRYFAEAVNSHNFIGKNCSNEYCWLHTCNSSQTAIFGLDTPAETRGIYFYSTNATEPYGLGEKGLD